MAKPLTLAIVIPAYNEESYLKRCLEAIAEQSVPADEVIVVDNNSQDKTVKIARSFPFVKLLSEKKQGLYYSRQTGLDAVKSDIVARIDADTIVDKHWVAAIKQGFADPDVHAATGPVGYHDMPLPEFTQKAEDMFLRFAKHIGRYDFMMGANMALRTSAWKKIRNHVCNEGFLFEDIDMVIHLSDCNVRPAYLPSMSAQMSSRRFADKPGDFLRYIGGHTRTLEYHDRDTPFGVHFAEGIFTALYFAVKPLHMTYDPERRRLSLNYLLSKREARPDPMAQG